MGYNAVWSVETKRYIPWDRTYYHNLCENLKRYIPDDRTYYHLCENLKRYIPDDRTYYHNLCENLKPYITNISLM
jgi:hypothetical protein